ncbi:MAG TPA: hypothetical protein VLJ11_14205 [Bryobacteraceae bacterium]|nr:hypothetical protein [Bryobacteraceae bacterium]
MPRERSRIRIDGDDGAIIEIVAWASTAIHGGFDSGCPQNKIEIRIVGAAHPGHAAYTKS